MSLFVRFGEFSTAPTTTGYVLSWFGSSSAVRFPSRVLKLITLCGGWARMRRPRRLILHRCGRASAAPQGLKWGVGAMIVGVGCGVVAQNLICSSTSPPEASNAVSYAALFFSRRLAAFSRESMRRWHFWQAAITCASFAHGGLHLHKWAVVRITRPLKNLAGSRFRSTQRVWCGLLCCPH
jgi:hypothetical protein